MRPFMKNCIRCGDTAHVWTGHIHTEIGTLSAGWCGNGGYCRKHEPQKRVRDAHCTSINPSSCEGRYKLSEIELSEPFTEDSMMAQMKYMEFSNRVDAELHGVSKNTQKQQTNTTKRRSRLFQFLSDLFC